MKEHIGGEGGKVNMEPWSPASLSGCIVVVWMLDMSTGGDTVNPLRDGRDRSRSIPVVCVWRGFTGGTNGIAWNSGQWYTGLTFWSFQNMFINFWSQLRATVSSVQLDQWCVSNYCFLYFTISTIQTESRNGCLHIQSVNKLFKTFQYLIDYYYYIMPVLFSPHFS